MAESLEDFTPEELAAMGRVYGQLVKNTKTRDTVLRATKVVAPDTSIPELDVMDKVATAISPHLKEIETMRQERLKEKVEARIESDRAGLREKGFSKDEISAVEKIMVEKKIPDYGTASEYFRMQAKTAPVTPANWTNPTRLPFDKEKTKAAGGFKNFFKQDAHQAIDDIRSGKIKLQ